MLWNVIINGALYPLKNLHILLHVKVICHTCCDTAPFFNSVWSYCQKWRQVWSSCQLKVATRRGTWFQFKVSDHFCHAILSTRPQASISFRANSLFLSHILDIEKWYFHSTAQSLVQEITAYYKFGELILSYISLRNYLVEINVPINYHPKYLMKYPIYQLIDDAKC